MKLTDILKQILLEEADRCQRIANRKYDKPSAYKSGAIVRCRKGKIWKDLKEELNELDISKHIKSWVDTKTLKKAKKFPESIFLYLKKNGYTNKGEIYRVLTLDPLVVIIKQNTEYIDLDKFLEDNQDIEPYSDLYSTYQDEKEVVARLDPNFSFEDIHYASFSNMDMSMYLKDLDKNKLKNDILKKDQGKLLSFTKEKEAAKNIFYTAIDFLEDEDNEYLNEDESLHKWFKRQGPSGKEGGWVDCNTCRKVDGKTKCKSCGRKKGEKRAKYPSCRPTPSQCKDPGKGKKWGKTK